MEWVYWLIKPLALEPQVLAPRALIANIPIPLNFQLGNTDTVLYIRVGVGEASFFKTRRFEASFWQEMGNNTEFEASFRQEMGNDTEFEAIFRREKGNDTIQDTSFFNVKREKQGKNWKNRGKNTKTRKKNRKKKQKITRKTETRF